MKGFRVLHLRGAHCVAGDTFPFSLPIVVPALLWLHRQPSLTLPAQARRVASGRSLHALRLHFPKLSPWGFLVRIRVLARSKAQGRFLLQGRHGPSLGDRSEENVRFWGPQPLAECEPTAGFREALTALQVCPGHGLVGAAGPEGPPRVKGVARHSGGTLIEDPCTSHRHLP